MHTTEVPTLTLWSDLQCIMKIPNDFAQKVIDGQLGQQMH